MENKKIKFPIAIVFIIIDLLLSVFSIAVSFKHYGMSVLFSYVLTFGSRMLLCCLLFRKKQDKILLIGTCAIAIPRLVFLIKNFTVINVFELFNCLLIIFIVGTAILPELSKFKHISEKIYFITAIICLLNPIDSIIYYCTKNDFYGEIAPQFSYIFSTLFGSLPWMIAVILFLKWCLDPYVKEKTKKENSNVYIAENIDNSTNNAILDYNESYCELVKHILLSLFTFGIWMLIWIYKTTKALNKAPNSEKYDPTKKLILCMFVPFYMIYWFYKHGEKIDKLNAVAGKKTDNTTMYLLLGIFIPVVACILMQDNINKLCSSDVYVAQASNSETSANTTVKDEKNTAEALKEYKSLLDLGVITQEEFDAKKKQLLDL